MATFFGFTTQDAENVRTLQVNTGVDGGAGSVTKPIRLTKKYRITDRDCVIQDFVNSLNITQGQLPGRPEYGTSLWSYIFEPNVNDTKVQIEDEIRRMANADPRIIVNTISAYPQGNGILVEIEIAVQLFTDPVLLQIYFDQNNNSARLL